MRGCLYAINPTEKTKQAIYRRTCGCDVIILTKLKGSITPKWRAEGADDILVTD